MAKNECESEGKREARRTMRKTTQPPAGSTTVSLRMASLGSTSLAVCAGSCDRQGEGEGNGKLVWLNGKWLNVKGSVKEQGTW